MATKSLRHREGMVSIRTFGNSRAVKSSLVRLQRQLKREIKEELATEIDVNEYVGTVDYDYPDFHITLLLYLCSMVSGNLELLEHESAKWLLASELDTVSWLPADLEIIPKLKSLLALN